MTTLSCATLLASLTRRLLCASVFVAATTAFAAPPVITSPTSIDIYYSFARGGSFASYQIVATNAPTSYDAAPLPPGASISSSSNLLLIFPEIIPVGIHYVTVSATNADGTAQQPLAIRVHPSPRSIRIALASGVVHPVYYPGDEVRISVDFNAPVWVTGQPSVSGMPYISGSGTTSLIFGLSVPPNTESYELNPIGLELNGGTIASAEALEASLSLHFGNPGTMPRIQNAALESASRTATVGTAFSYQPAHSVSEPAFRASGLPAGLSINPGTGEVSGTPTASGTFSAELGASGPGGRPDVTGTLTLTISPAPTPPPPPTTPPPPVTPPPITPPPAVTIASGSAGGIVNQDFNYTVSATGSPSTFSATGLPPGLSIDNSGVITGTPVATGTYAVDVSATNPEGGTGSGILAITITAPPTPPVTPPTSPPLPTPPPPPPTPPPPAPAKENQAIDFTSPVSAIIVNQPIILGANASSNLPVTFTIVSGNATLSGRQLTIRDTHPVVVRAAQPGNEDYNAASAVDVVFIADATTSPVGPGESPERTDRLANLSSRLNFVSNDASRSAVAGFSISGSEAKPVLIRAIGPALAGFDVAGAHPNPRLQLYSGSTLVAENDDWVGTGVSDAGDRVGAFALPSDSRDAALVVTLQPGGYTAMVQGEGGGVVLIEVYDAAPDRPVAAQKLVNVSARGFVGTGENQLIAGFVIAGNASKRVLIRGIGPGLTQFDVPGVIGDPKLELHLGGEGNVLARNDDWSAAQPIDASQAAATAADISAASAAAGAFPLAGGSKDAAIVITLPPGQYSAIMSGVNDGTGAGLIEVYELPTP